MKKHLLILLSFTALVLSGCAQDPKPIEFVRELPQQAFPETVVAGNYSGITHVKGNQYAVANDKSPQSGFYFFYIEIDSISGEITNVRMDSLLTNGQPNRDEEAIAYVPSSNTLFVAGEADHRIVEYNLDGSLTGRELNIPEIYKTARRNLSFEALAYNAKTQKFWTSSEGPSPCDGEVASSKNLIQNKIRIQSFNKDLQPDKQYAYLMDVPVARDTVTTNSQTGLSSIIALDDGRLIVLERELFFVKEYFGSYFNEKIYVVNPKKGTPITSETQLTDETPYLEKEFLYEWRTDVSVLSYELANYEAMCLGPRLANGDQTILMVCDSQNQYLGLLKDWFKVLIVRGI